MLLGRHGKNLKLLLPVLKLRKLNFSSYRKQQNLWNLQRNGGRNYLLF